MTRSTTTAGLQCPPRAEAARAQPATATACGLELAVAASRVHFRRDRMGFLRPWGPHGPIIRPLPGGER